MEMPGHNLLQRLVLRVLAIGSAALLTPAMALGQVQFQQPPVAKWAALGNPWPTSFVTGSFQKAGTVDFMAIYPPRYATLPNGLVDPGMDVSEILNNGSGTFSFPNLNSIGFNEVTNVVATSADFNRDGVPDVAFALSHPISGYEDICVEFLNAGGSFNQAQSGCTTLPLTKTLLPVIKYIASTTFKTGGISHLILEDSANHMVYLVQNSGVINTTAGALPTFTLKSQYAIPLTDGTGPILTGDFNGDGNTDFVLNGQDGNSASIYLGNGDGTFQAPARYTFGSGILSLLMQDMDGDGHADMIVESSAGVIQVFHGNADGTFQTTSMGGASQLNPLVGGGGQLVGIADLNHDGVLDLVTATPIGISVLLGQGNLTYSIGGIYNAGPGHSSYALRDFNGDGNLDLAVDSPEGIAILYGNPDGSFQTSHAFAAGQPATSAVVGKFTSSGFFDTVVATGETQGQFLRGAGDGSFTYAGSPGVPVPTSNQSGGAGIIGSVAAADFEGDGKLDLVFTGDGSNASLAANASGVYVQTGNGDGTFAAPVAPIIAQQFYYPPTSSCSPPFNHFPGIGFGTSVTGDFNGDGLADIANRDAGSYRILRGNNNTSSSSYSTIPTLFSAYVDGYVSTVDCDAHAHDLVIAGDLNGDGRTDLIFQGSLGSSGSLLEFLSDPTGKAVQMGDLAVDGSLTTPGQATAPALNVVFNGAAISTTSGGLGFPAFPGSAVIADLDGDGSNDLIVTYANLAADRTAPSSAAPNRIYIWFGSGGGKFLTSAKHPVNPVVLTPSRNFYQVAVGDLDGDGILDLILSDGYVVSVQLGKGDGTFGAETHYLAGQGLNTIAVADVDHNGKFDVVVANGGTVWANPVANLDQQPAAQHVNTGGVTVLLNRPAVVLPTISATVTATPEPSTYGSAFAITAAIAPSTSSVNPVTGSFAFAVDGIAIGSANITGTSATVVAPSFLYSTLMPGVHTLTAAYTGDTNWSPSTISGTHTVSLNPTTLSLILCVDPPNSNFPCATPISATPLISPISMYYGQSVDGVAIESALNLTGTITFYNGSSIFCVLNANLQQGTQTCPPTSGVFPAGTTTVTVVYSGDSLNAGSTSNGVVVNVLPDPTTATVTSSMNPSTLGQAVTFTGSVQGNFAVGAGPVIFLDGSTTLGTATLDASGHASLTTSTLAVGTHPIKVAFPGSANFNSTTSAALNQVVQAVNVPLQSVIALSSNINPSTPGQAVIFTATVSVVVPGTIPTGTVTFMDGTAIIGTSTNSATTGVATFTTSLLTAGSHSITATYTAAAGTPTVLPSTSAVLTQVVAASIVTGGQGFTLTVTPTPVTVGAGATAILLVKIQTAPGFGQSVALTCTGLPPESGCTFVQPLIPSGGGSTTLQFAVAAPHACFSSTPYFVGDISQPPTSGTVTAITIPALFAGGFLFAGILRRRKGPWLVLTVLAASLCGLAMISGCSSCTDLGTKPGSYTLTIVATAQGGPSTEVETQVIPVTVTIP